MKMDMRQKKQVRKDTEQNRISLLTGKNSTKFLNRITIMINLSIKLIDA